MMPASPRTAEDAVQLGTVSVTEQAWSVRQPHPGADPPKAFTIYVVRRGTVPAGAPLQ
jgi:hypothetical protein